MSLFFILKKMFQNKTNASSSATQNTSQADNGLENFVIHTMKKDLDELNNPSLKKEASQTSSAPQKTMPITAVKSPFFTPLAEKKPANLPTEPTKKEPVKQPPIDAPKPSIVPITQIEKAINQPIQPTKPAQKIPEKASSTTSKTGTPTNFKTVMIVVISILLLLILTTGGYYFWTTRQTNPPIVIAPPMTEPTPIIEPIPEPIPAPAFSTDKPNYLNIDLKNSDSAKIKETLSKYAADVLSFGSITPVEFIIVDENNNPIAFQDFALKTEILFSPVLMQNLSEQFSLFIYNDKNNAHLGLSIASKDSKKLQSLILQEETNMVRTLNLLFPQDNPPADKFIPEFNTSQYNTTEIRYVNFSLSKELSIDYAIIDQNLVFATTKMTMYSIIDHLKNINLPANLTIDPKEIPKNTPNNQ